MNSELTLVYLQNEVVLAVMFWYVCEDGCYLHVCCSISLDLTVTILIAIIC